MGPKLLVAVPISHAKPPTTTFHCMSGLKKYGLTWLEALEIPSSPQLN